MEPENDTGNIEYKRIIDTNDPNRLISLTTQMKYRLSESDNSDIAYYYVGINDDGSIYGLTNDELNKSIQTLSILARNINCEIDSFDITKHINNPRDQYAKYSVKVCIKKYNNISIDNNIRICMLGDVNCSKSSTIGTLVSGKYDNGRGSSRDYITKLKHELESQKTSSISHHLIGFDNNGVQFISDDWASIMDKCNKTISLIDLAGHERYFKTTILGACSTHPDYALLLIDGKHSIKEMTKEHIKLCLSLRIPFIILITKIDVAPIDKINITIDSIKKLANSPGIKKIPYFIKSNDDIFSSISHINKSLPIFSISNVTGEGLDLLKLFLNYIPKRNIISTGLTTSANENYINELSIGSCFTVRGIGCVVHGNIIKGSFSINDDIWIGPDKLGKYKKSIIKSIHYKHVPVKHIHGDCDPCFNLKNINVNHIKKGMSIITHDPDTLINKGLVKIFRAHVKILEHPTTICEGYQPVLHINNIKQSVIIKTIYNNNKYLRLGEEAEIDIEFKYYPVFMDESYINKEFIFREGKARARGKIILI